MKFILKALVVFQLLLVLAKLCGLVGITWFQVFLPTIITLSPAILLCACGIIGAVIAIIATVASLVGAAIIGALFELNINIK